MSEVESMELEIDKADTYNNNGKFHLAIEVSNQVLQKIQQTPISTKETSIEREELRIRALNVISFAEVSQGNYEEAHLHAQNALNRSIVNNLKKSTANSLLMIGYIYFNQSAYEEALEFYGKSYLIYSELCDKRLKAKVRGEIGKVYFNLGSYPEALECYTEILATYKEIDHKILIANTLSCIAIVYSFTGQLEESLQYYTEALSKYKEEGNKKLVAEVIGNIGNIYIQRALYDEAFDCLTTALQLNEELGLPVSAALIRGSLATFYMQIADYQKALEYFAASLEVLKNVQKVNSIIILDSIGTVYKALHDNTLSLEYHHRALALSIELGAKGNQAVVMGNLGNSYLAIGDYESALQYLQGALELSLALGTLRPAGYWMHGIALLEINRGNLEKAEEGMLQTLHHRRQVLKTNEGVARVLYDLAEIKYRQSKLDEALDFYNEALTLVEETGERDIKSIICFGISNIYSLLGDPVRALDYYKQYHTIEKEVQSEAATKQAQLLEHRRKIEESERDRQIKLARFQEQEKILHNILPAQIAERMVQGETTIAESYEHVSVFFSDIVSFTELSQSVTAEELVALLNGIFSQFDQLARKHGLEKIKTIGDAYMAVAGAPVRVEDHAARAASFAVDVANFMENYRTPSGEKIGLRIGLHTGSVVAGIIGENKFAYDLWGDAVNTASRMESHGEAGKIHVSEEFMQAMSLSSLQSFQSLHFHERGELDIKGKGKMNTYFLEKA